MTKKIVVVSCAGIVSEHVREVAEQMVREELKKDIPVFVLDAGMTLQVLELDVYA